MTVPAAVAFGVWLLLPQPVATSRHASATNTIAPNRAFVCGSNLILLLEAVNISVPLQGVVILPSRGIPRAYEISRLRRNRKNWNMSRAEMEAESVLLTSSLRRNRLRLPQTEQTSPESVEMNSQSLHRTASRNGRKLVLFRMFKVHFISAPPASPVSIAGSLGFAREDCYAKD